MGSLKKEVFVGPAVPDVRHSRTYRYENVTNITSFIAFPCLSFAGSIHHLYIAAVVGRSISLLPLERKTFTSITRPVSSTLSFISTIGLAIEIASSSAFRLNRGFTDLKFRP